jgi:hypothetical protein
MTSPRSASSTSSSIFGDIRLGAVAGACKQFLNGLAELAHRSAERSRFAHLHRRYLDDVGMTIAERDAQVL